MSDRLRFRAPAFWSRTPGFTARLLQPLSTLVGGIANRRRRQSGWRAPVPVLCCGNLSVGGTGKTTVVLDLAARLQARGIRVHVLTRGYGGRLGHKEPVQVDPIHHMARDVGDEALLLAGVAPCWIGGDRAASARKAVAAGAECLLMDDGFQNPGLARTVSLLLVDGAVGFGNGLVLPAGPLREPLASGLDAADAVLITGTDQMGIDAMIARLEPRLPRLHATFGADERLAALRGTRVVAFAGLARPGKFFDSLRAGGVQPLRCMAFPDHHPFTPRDLDRLARAAAELDAHLVTTPKDAVRLPPAFRASVTIVGIHVEWTDPGTPERLLDGLLESAGRSRIA